TDGSETLSVRIEGVPEGATLNAGTDNGAGTWDLTVAELDGLEITPPANFSGEFDLTVEATSTDDGDTATTTQTLTVTVEGVADTPTLEVSDASGMQGTSIDLHIDAALTDIDGSETLSVRIEGVPARASLNVGIDNGDGTWDLTPAELDGLKIIPHAKFTGAFDLTVTATATDGSDTASMSATLGVQVEALPEVAEPDPDDIPEVDKPAEPELTGRPEVEWTGAELASVAEGLDDLEAKVVDLTSDVQEMVEDLNVIDLGEAGEYTLVYEAGETMPDEGPDRGPEPGGFLYETTRGDATEEQAPPARTYEPVEERETPTALASAEEEVSVRERVTNALGGLFGLVRSIGPRDTQDERGKN
ncbi:MAG: Ig-like domain-containing protein, partial [Myxococcota bacterium]